MPNAIDPAILNKIVAGLSPAQRKAVLTPSRFTRIVAGAGAGFADLEAEARWAEYRLSPEEQVCPNCGGPLHEMSTEVRQELKVIPA